MFVLVSSDCGCKIIKVRWLKEGAGGLPYEEDWSWLQWLVASAGHGYGSRGWLPYLDESVRKLCTVGSMEMNEGTPFGQDYVSFSYHVEVEIEHFYYRTFHMQSDTDPISPAGQPLVSREKTAPFLIRAFVKVGTFHRLSLFEEGMLPTTDEHQLFTWRDATLCEVLTTLRNAAPQIPEFRHPLARYAFRAIYADGANKGRFAQKELGTVYSRDILGEPGTLDSTAPRLLEDTDGQDREPTEREKEERTLEELRFVPGDYLCISVILPKGTAPGPVQGDVIAKQLQPNGWRAQGPPARVSDGGWNSGAHAPTGRGGGHWRGDSNPPPPSGGRGRGGRSGDFAGRDRDFDRTREPERRPPPRRDSPPHRGGRGGRGGRRSPSYSRSRSPPRRRTSRYD